LFQVVVTIRPLVGTGAKQVHAAFMRPAAARIRRWRGSA
jgi:hypothetical protein